MKTYRYLYYKLFCIWLKKRDEPENAHINAIISISFLVCINIISIPLILMAAFGTDIIAFPELKQKWPAFLIVIAFGISQYFLFAHKKKYLQIAKEFENESDKQRRKGLFYTWIYIAISLGIPLYIFFFTIPR